MSRPRMVLAVDAGFIVYNEVTYPNLTRLFSWLDVPTEPTDMSFAFSLDRQFEYGASPSGVLAQPGNLLGLRFLRMLRDINHFRLIGTTLEPEAGENIGDLLQRNGFSQGFLEDYLYPMTGAIWSAPQSDISGFPAASILRFLTNHGLIEIVGRPRWRTVTGGSRSYVQRLVAGFSDRILIDSPVDRIIRLAGEVLVESNGRTQSFDQIILSTHADQALAILGEDATDAERALLGDIRYEPNVAVLHSDPSLMPRNRRVWSSWNAMAQEAGRRRQVASVTYWMNRLQNLDASYSLFVSLNPLREPDPGQVHARFAYAHPQFDLHSEAAQQVSPRSRADFIQQYIFPGGQIPAPKILEALAGKAQLVVEQVETFGLDYARTLAAWRDGFLEAWPALTTEHGLDERFRRM